MKKIRFVGDTIFSKSINKYIDQDYLWVINFESSIKSEKPINKTINLCSDENEIYKNNIILNLANNHIMDFGSDGFMKLIKLLDKKNINYFGAGINLDESIKPCIIDFSNKKVGFLGFAWNVIQSMYSGAGKCGVSPLNGNLIRKSIEYSKKYVDFLFVSLHAGYEYELYPLPAHRILAHKIIDWGGDLVIGHHPHLYQGKEVYKGKSIYYSLGNYYMPRIQFGKKTLKFREESNIGLVLDITFKDNSFVITEHFSHFDPISNEIKIIDDSEQRIKLMNLSKPFIYSDKLYLKFFLRNRKRKTFLPIYTGSENDYFRDMFMKFRTKLIEKIRR